MATENNTIDWTQIDTVFLDMDGTLMDLAFDNYFWHEYVPQVYSKAKNIDHKKAKELLVAMYKNQRGTLNWYCTDYWTRTLGLNITELKHQIVSRVCLFPHVNQFLSCLKHCGKRPVLLTNAHQDSIAIKMNKTGIAPLFDRIICSHYYGHAKESDRFWPLLAQDEDYRPARTLLIDDNVAVLKAAHRHGIKFLLSVAQPDSTLPAQDTEGFVAIRGFAKMIFELSHQSGR